MKRLLVLFLALGLPLGAASEPCARVAAATAAQTERPAWVDPNLEGKTVKVYFRDGRLYEGKLVELTNEALQLKMGKRVETIPLTEVARVERKPRLAWLPFAVAGVALGMIAVAVLITVAALD